MSTYKQIVLASRPKNEIVPSEVFRTEEVGPIPTKDTPKDGEFVIRVDYLSLDPAMRGWMNDTKSYVPPVKIGETMRAYGIGTVTFSKHPRYNTGDLVAGTFGWREYVITTGYGIEKVILPQGATPRDFLSTLGMTGLTAYFGLLRHVPENVLGPNCTVVVSAGAGATGSVVGQIAKVKGCKVIGIAGGEGKCRWVTGELGWDGCVDYKKKGWERDLREAVGKSGINVYFDNVGGDILDECLKLAAPHANFIICGSISQYNTSKPQGPRAFLLVISKRITMKGFIVFDFLKEYDQARKELAQWLFQGKIKRMEHIVEGGIDAAPRALVQLFEGANTGKMMVKVSSEEEVPTSSVSASKSKL